MERSWSGTFGLPTMLYDVAGNIVSVPASYIKSIPSFWGNNIITIDPEQEQPIKSVDDIIPYIATIKHSVPNFNIVKTATTHTQNIETPYQLCNQHGNRFVCSQCHKFFNSVK